MIRSLLVACAVAACGGAAGRSPAAPPPTVAPAAAMPASPPPVSPAPPDTDAAPPSAACAGDERRAFDFWLGRWRVHHGRTGEVVGSNTISRAEGGCALVERWRSARGTTGRSFTAWDPHARQWVQHWVDARGALIDLRGGPVDGAMVLTGRYAEPDGTESLLRGTWTPQEDGTVVQAFERSTDGGATWSTWFVGIYRRQP